MKKTYLLLLCVSLAVTACENQWMASILHIKKITFDSNGGSHVPPQTVKKDGKISEPQDPTKDGYSFGGWFEDNDTFFERWDFNMEPYGNMTLYAGWLGEDGELIITTPIIDFNELEDYLNNSQEGGTANNPVKIRLNITDDMLVTVDGISKLTSILNESGKYVYLDLSGSTIQTIPDESFSDCAKLTGIIIPNGITGIGNQAFSQCTNLTSINIPNSVKTIGAYAFYICSSLTSVTIPDTVKTIETQAFFGCQSFTSITIPRNVESIGGRAFYSCTNLTRVTFEGTINNISNDAFGSPNDSGYIGDLHSKYINTTNGGPGTYERQSGGTEWTKIF